MVRKVYSMSDLLSEVLEWRACSECPAIWFGALQCKFCGAPGEPIEEDLEPVLLEAANNAGSTLPN